MLYQAVVNREIRIQLPTLTEGLSIGDLTLFVVSGGQLLADPVTTLVMGLVEVDPVDFAGFYELSLTPNAEGPVYLYLHDPGKFNIYELYLQVALEAIDMISLRVEGATAEYTFNIDDGTNPLSGVLVKVYDDAGTHLLTVGYTDSSGQLTVTLPVGDYKARLYKEGQSFSNPISFTVSPPESVTPIIDFLLPSTAGEDDLVAIKGSFFGEDAEVDFGGVVTTTENVSADGTLLTFIVPATTLQAVPVRVRKPDPAHPGSYLYSNLVTLVVG